MPFRDTILERILLFQFFDQTGAKIRPPLFTQAGEDIDQNGIIFFDNVEILGLTENHEPFEVSTLNSAAGFSYTGIRKRPRSFNFVVTIDLDVTRYKIEKIFEFMALGHNCSFFVSKGFFGLNDAIDPLTGLPFNQLYDDSSSFSDAVNLRFFQFNFCSIFINDPQFMRSKRAIGLVKGLQIPFTVSESKELPLPTS